MRHIAPLMLLAASGCSGTSINWMFEPSPWDDDAAVLMSNEIDGEDVTIRLVDNPEIKGVAMDGTANRHRFTWRRDIEIRRSLGLCRRAEVLVHEFNHLKHWGHSGLSWIRNAQQGDALRRRCEKRNETQTINAVGE